MEQEYHPGWPPPVRLPVAPDYGARFRRSRIPRVLAVVRVGRAADEQALQWALALAEEHGARLSVLGLWTASAWWRYLPMSGCIDVVALLAEERLWAESWLYRRLGAALDRRTDLIIARGCVPVGRAAGHELRERPYTHLVGARGTISKRAARRWQTRYRPLTVIRV